MHKIPYISIFLLFAFSAEGIKASGFQDTITVQPGQRQVPTIREGTDADRQPEETAGDSKASLFMDTTLYFNQLKMPADSVESWRRAKAFEYAGYLDSLLKLQQQQETVRITPTTDSGPGWLDRLLSSPATSVFFWILAAVFIGFILYKLFLTEGLFRKAVKKDKDATPEVKEELITGETDFDLLIQQAIRTGNYRLGVRYLYLKTLHQLAGKRFIELAADKTNYQYVREIGTHPLHSGLQNDFAALTLNYEYVWYGEFAIEEAIYKRIETGFKSFNQSV